MTDDRHFARLRQAASQLDGSGLKLLEPHDSTRAADASRLLSGSRLRAPEISSGLATTRRIGVAERIFGLEDAVDLLGSLGGRTLLLRGEAGEGKSTYLEMLRLRLSSWAVLRWSMAEPLSRPALQRFREVLESYFEVPKSAPRVLVVGEVLSLSEAALAAVVDVLNDRDLDDDDPSVFLITGRPGEVNAIRSKLRSSSTVSAHLLRLDESEASQLSAAIKGAATEVTGQGLRLAEHFPNLSLFLRSSSATQAEQLAGGARPLLAGLLDAVYGHGHRQIVLGEYRQLSPADAEAYLHVALAHQAGTPLPDRLLERLAPNADLARRRQLDPWDYDDEDGTHLTRHAYLALVLLDGVGSDAELLDSVQRWLQVAGDSSTNFRFVELALRNLVEPFEPVPPGSKLGNRLRRAVRRALLQEEDLQEWIVTRVGRNVRSTELWAGTIYLACRDSKGPEVARLLRVAQALISQLLALPVEQHSPYWDYYAGKVELKLRQPEDPDSMLTGQATLDRWLAYDDYSPFKPDFYADVFQLAAKLFEANCVTAEVNQQLAKDQFRALSWAWIHLRATSGQPGRLVYYHRQYSTAVARYLYVLPVDTRLGLLRDAWSSSLTIDAPLYQTAVHIAKVLLSAPTAPSTEAVAEAYELLSAAANSSEQALGLLGEAALLLVQGEFQGKEWPGPVPTAAQLEVRLQTASGLAAAFLNHAYALLLSGPDRVNALKRTVDGYADSLRQNEDNLSEWRHVWRSALRELRAADPAAADARQQVFNKAK